MMLRLILSIDNKNLQKAVEKYFQDSNVWVEIFGNSKTYWQKIIRSCGDVIVISESLIPSPKENGIAMLNELPESPTTVVLHNNDSSENHAQLVAAGADVVLYAGIFKKSLIEAIESTLESRRQFIFQNRMTAKSSVSPKISDFVSESRAMQIFMKEVWKIIPGESPLLILGETGVGKEHLAKAIHAESARSTGPFITVNTAALPEQLLESELFGHEQGAFTGAIRSRRGAFEMAHGGIIFLDEIGEMPLHLQVKLLRVLQEYEVQPIGSERPIWVDIRVIAATNRDLEEEVKKGNFRKDLYYRLSVIMLTIPPLHQHKEDIPTMVEHFIELYRHKIGKHIEGFSKSAMDALCRYDWPGNIRELMNVIERAILLCQKDKIDLQDLPHIFHQPIEFPKNFFLTQDTIPESWDNKTLPEVKQEVIDHMEKLYIQMVLKKTRGRVAQAAKIANIHTRALYNKMKRLGIKKESFKNQF